jgi:hypothetical protein
MVLNKGDCPELPAGIRSSKPMLFNLCCVESNLKTNTSCGVELACPCSFEHELKHKKIAGAKISTHSCFMPMIVWGKILKRYNRSLIVQ